MGRIRRIARELHYQTIGRKHIHAWRLTSRITRLMPAGLRQAVIVDAGCRATQSSVIGMSNYAGPDGLEFSHLYEAAAIPYGGSLGDGPEHHALRERTKRLEAWIEPSDAQPGLPNPDEAEQASPEFQAIWSVIKTWDVNVPEHYVGYCGANGSHVKLLLDALDEVRAETLVEVLARDLFDNRLGWSGGAAPHAPIAFWMALGMALGVNPQWALTEFANEGDAMTTMDAAETLYAQAVGSTS
jgi:hypothetical protein